MHPKEVALHFMLHINEDLDDDLLQDSLELLDLIWLFSFILQELYIFYQMSMFQRTFEADPPVYVVSFKLHYKVKPGDAVYLAIDGRN